MKRKLVVLSIILVGGAILLLPLIKEKPRDFSIRPAAAVFDFKGDPGTFVGKESQLNIKLIEEKIKKLEVVYLGEVLKSWTAPTGDLSVTFVPTQVGTSTIQLVSVASDGREFTDNRYLRVLSDVTPLKRSVEIVAEYDHNIMNYTQGLDFYKGDLYEGTGQYGSSRVCRIRLEDGMDKDGVTLGLDGNYFGEGITIMDDLIYQLTWQKGKCFTYKIYEDYIQLDGEFNYAGQEGWGLCNDGTSLIMSDGTERITFRNPESFQVERVIDVYNDKGPIVALNELEFIDGKIYANVYQTNVVVAIDPETGKILEEIDCSILEVRGMASGDVLNGIAYNELDGKIYMTGKYWAKLFEVKFVESN